MIDSVVTSFADKAENVLGDEFGRVRFKWVGRYSQYGAPPWTGGAG